MNIIKTVTYAIAGFLLSAFLVQLMVIGKRNNDEYNAHMCAVYGKQPDCKTPLEGK